VGLWLAGCRLVLGDLLGHRGQVGEKGQDGDGGKTGGRKGSEINWWPARDSNLDH